MTVVEFLFGVLSLVAIGSALLVVTTTRLVHAALWLVVTLGALAGCYLLLAAEFVAWVQVLIYVGAVVVLLLFALMLTRAPTGAESGTTTANRPLAALVALAVAAGLVTVLVAGFRDVEVSVEGTVVGTAGTTGEAIFTSWVLPFEVLSVLLLAALVGAIVLSRSSSRPDLPASRRPDRPASSRPDRPASSRPDRPARGSPAPDLPASGTPVPDESRDGSGR